MACSALYGRRAWPRTPETQREGSRRRTTNTRSRPCRFVHCSHTQLFSLACGHYLNVFLLLFFPCCQLDSIVEVVKKMNKVSLAGMYMYMLLGTEFMPWLERSAERRVGTWLRIWEKYWSDKPRIIPYKKTCICLREESSPADLFDGQNWKSSVLLNFKRNYIYYLLSLSHTRTFSLSL